MCGYANPLVFKEVDDSDILAVQEFIKNRTMNILSTDLHESIGGECDVLVDEQKLDEFFGPIYKNDTNNFEFRAGDKKLIKQIVSYVKNAVDGNGVNSGIKHFMPKRNPSKRKAPILKNKIEINNGEACEVDMIDADHSLELKTSLFKKIIDCCKLFKVNELVDLENVDPNIVSVSMKNGQIYGDVHCIVCQNNTSNERQKTKRVSFHSGTNSSYWIPSNFITHLKKTHKLEQISAECSEPKKVKVEVVDETTNENINESLIITKVELPYNTSKINVSADELYEQISQQITAMTQRVFTCDLNECEMKIKLSENDSRVINIVEVPGDGNCLFTSLVHQLFGLEFGTKEMKVTRDQLRADVVDYINKNFELFEHEIKGRILDNIEDKKLDKNSDSKMPVDIQTESKFFVNQLLSRNRFWGGSETLKAVSGLHKVNIIIFNEDDICQIIHSFGNVYDKTIGVAFRIGMIGENAVRRNHYDSVSDIKSNDIYALVEYLTTTKTKEHST